MKDRILEDKLKELREVLPKSNFYRQPETSGKELKKLEDKYNLSTKDFLNKEYGELGKDITEEDTNKWLNESETYLLFGGEIK